MTKNNVQTALFTAELEAVFKTNGVHRLIDATFGEGGHGMLFGSKGCEVLGIEWDQEMFQQGLERIRTAKLEASVRLVNGNFRDIAHLAEQAGFLPADAVIADLGLSMKQIKTSKRGFTYNGDEALDLRINVQQEVTASQIIKSWSKEELYEAFTKYIEDIDTPRFVGALVIKRSHETIDSVGALKKVIEKIKMTDRDRMQFLRKVLQGLRSIVNDEPASLAALLRSLSAVLKKGGVVGIISFHSLEDRMVKLFFKGNKDFISLGKPLKNSEFSFASSAQLRLYQRV